MKNIAVLLSLFFLSLNAKVHCDNPTPPVQFADGDRGDHGDDDRHDDDHRDDDDRRRHHDDDDDDDDNWDWW
jgi:hypothetical protein